MWLHWFQLKDHIIQVAGAVWTLTAILILEWWHNYSWSTVTCGFSSMFMSFKQDDISHTKYIIVTPCRGLILIQRLYWTRFQVPLSPCAHSLNTLLLLCKGLQLRLLSSYRNSTQSSTLLSSLQSSFNRWLEGMLLAPKNCWARSRVTSRQTMMIVLILSPSISNWSKVILHQNSNTLQIRSRLCLFLPRVIS